MAQVSNETDSPLPPDRPVFSTTPNGRVSYRRIVMVAGFVLLLIIPLLDQWLGFLSGFKSTEKRILTPFPTFQFPHVMTFVREFDQYYKENFGGRNALFYQYSRWKYNVLGSSPLPHKVVLGKQGWCYPGNSLGNITDQHIGLRKLSPTDLQAISNHLTMLQQKLARQGIKLYVTVAPDSYSIYPEYLPDYIQKSGSYSPLSVLRQYLNQRTTIPFIDVSPALKASKADHIVYCQTDSHWNNYGSFMATLTLINRMRQDFPSIPKGRLSDYRIETEKGGEGDLTTMLALNDQLADSINYRITPALFLKSTQHESTMNPGTGLPSQRFTGVDPKRPKLVFFGDSFSYSMNLFLPGYFSEAFMARNGKFEPSLLIKYHPDVVVIEIVERNITHLADL